MRKTRRNVTGFTLVELMVAVVVLAILAALAVPSFNDFFERGRVRNAAEDLVSLVSNARVSCSRNQVANEPERIVQAPRMMIRPSRRIQRPLGAPVPNSSSSSSPPSNWLAP